MTAPSATVSSAALAGSFGYFLEDWTISARYPNGIPPASFRRPARAPLPQGIPDSFLQLLRLVGRELLVYVDPELLVDLIHQLVVSGEDLYVAVCGQSGAALSHVLLDNRSTRHCVVASLEVAVDRLRGDFLTQPLLDHGVCGVEARY